MASSDHTNNELQDSKEIRVNSDELNFIFAESCKFDPTPSSYLQSDDLNKGCSFTQNERDTAFFPTTNADALELIETEEDNDLPEDPQIKDSYSKLVSMKLRAETPFLKHKRDLEYLQSLEKAVEERDQHIAYLGKSIREQNRTHIRITQESKQTLSLVRKQNVKNLKLMSVLIVFFSTLSALSIWAFSDNTSQASMQNQMATSQSESQQKLNSSTKNRLASNFKRRNYEESSKVKQYHYTVKKNDSISKISKKIFGSSKHYKRIAKENNLGDNQILKPGRKLIITLLEE